jgi:hypothetical protein
MNGNTSGMMIVACAGLLDDDNPEKPLSGKPRRRRVIRFLICGRFMKFS